MLIYFWWFYKYTFTKTCFNCHLILNYKNSLNLIEDLTRFANRKKFFQLNHNCPNRTCGKITNIATKVSICMDISNLKFPENASFYEYLTELKKKKKLFWEEVQCQKSYRLYPKALPKLESFITLRIFRNISSSQLKKISWAANAHKSVQRTEYYYS